MNEKLFDTIHRLKNINIRIPQVCQMPGKPVLLDQWIRKKAVQQNISGDVAHVDFKELYRKVKWQLTHNALLVFDQRYEIPFLPLLFIGSQKEEEKFYDCLINDISMALRKEIRRSCRRRTFQNLVFSYFKIYGQKDKDMQVRNCIMLFLKYDSRLSNSVLYLWNRKQLLQPFGHKQFTLQLLQDQSIEKALENFSWPPTLWNSSFIFYGINEFFQLPKLEWNTLYNVFQEVCTEQRYYDLLPTATSKMILATNDESNPNCQKAVRNLLLKNFGDPRDRANIFWPKVQLNARQIFLSWLKKNDLNIFFTIISKTVGISSNSARMWKYRKKFWSDYIDNMYYTRVFLGPDAEKIAKQEDLDSEFGLLSGSGDSMRSLFMFSIQDYVFIECSHNGSLRVWHKDKQPLPFYENANSNSAHRYSDITNSHYVLERFIHSNAEGGGWQKKVGTWIAMHCGISLKTV